jgi:alkylresorcinol/alkylpyrone synthase
LGRIVAVGTAVPEYEVDQREAQEFARGLFQRAFVDIDRLLTIFDHAAIERRRFSQPRSWFEQDHSFAERNGAYVEAACNLGEEAIRRCLKRAGLTPREVDHFIFVSSTGLSTPSIDAHLVNRLGMNPRVKRTPLWGLGCAGGVAGLARAFEVARAFPEQRVLLLALELCGLTFRRNDLSKSNLVATSLFADGAAAVLIAGEKAAAGTDGPRIIDATSMTWPRSLDVMGWEVVDDGLKVIFSKDIPSIVRRKVRPVVEEFLGRWKLTPERVERYIAHPGGAKVLTAYEEALSLKETALSRARSVLRSHGNMSSATVLFVLEQEMREKPEAGTYGLITALGPGFSLELMLIQWEDPSPPERLEMEKSFSRRQRRGSMTPAESGADPFPIPMELSLPNHI